MDTGMVGTGIAGGDRCFIRPWAGGFQNELRRDGSALGTCRLWGTGGCTPGFGVCHCQGLCGTFWVKLMSEEHQQCLVRSRAEPTLGRVEQGWMSECTGASPAWPWLPLEGVEAGGASGWILYFPSLLFTFIPSSRTSALAGVTLTQPSVSASLGAVSHPHPAGKGCSGRNLGRRAGVCPALGPVCAAALGVQEGSASGGGVQRWPCTNIRVCPRQGLLQNTILSVHTSK